MRYYITLLICLYLSLDLSAQSNESWQEYLGRIGQVEDVDRGQLEQLYDDLDETYQTKIDINTCTREELLQLPFLSEQQVMDIMEYRYKAGRIQSLMELYLVPSLERTDVLRLNSFLIVSPEAEADTLPSLRNLLMYGKQEVTADFNLPFYERQGDKDGYLGYKYKHWALFLQLPSTSKIRARGFSRRGRTFLCRPKQSWLRLLLFLPPYQRCSPSQNNSHRTLSFAFRNGTHTQQQLRFRQADHAE